MKFSLKTLAAAVVLATAAAGASAAPIDNGAGGNGGLFFNAFDGVSSYSFNLNTSIDAFETAKNTAGLYNVAWGAAQGFSPSFNNWLSTANASTLEWNILATDTAGARRILSTVGGALPATNKTADVLRTSATAVQGFVNAVNPTLVGNSGVTTSTSASSYAGKVGSNVYNTFNFDTTGNLAANSYLNGLTFQKTTANATGLTNGLNTAYTDDTLAVRAWIGSDSALHIGAVAAVPEPESYAMLLAGLGMIGFMARRRLNNRV